MATVELREATKRYRDGTVAVRRLSLEVRDGELMILVGPSGCGKTTALRMIAGLEEIDEGDLLIDGEVVTELTPKQRDIAMVFQSYALYPHMRVAENMGFALKLAGVAREEIDRRVLEAARVLDLEGLLHRKPGELSGGQRQRVAIGRAIVRDPRVFLMDEPLSNLDAKLRVQMRAEIAQLQRRLGTTTVYVTHDQTEAMTLGHRVAVMRDGVLQQLATPAELYEQHANLFVAGFLGSPGMNLLPGRVERGHLHLPIGDVPLPPGAGAAVGDGPVIAGIRPEHFEDAAVAGDRPGAVRIRTRLDLVESLGRERFAHFHAEGEGLDHDRLARLAGEAAGPRTIVARLDAASRLRGGEVAELTLSPGGIRLFDPETGERLAGGGGSGAGAAHAPDAGGGPMRLTA
ncbi:MAG: sn-glycerol-3-phosphate ABC transporter ATP-binding protein UgpC [Thermoleophilia bacterium]|nr:sn-glycerol-3-phosphate ABC transporter ATP-binding protein UgpC [Thermoleophilia bacterium]